MIDMVLRSLSREKLSVFLFHKIPLAASRLAPYDLAFDEFQRMLDYIAERFNVVPLDEATRLLGAGKLPERAACLTFDDGYCGWVEHVMPELLTRQLHATFFITTGQFSGKPMWHERVEQALSLLPTGKLGLPNTELDDLLIVDEASRLPTLRRVEQYLKYLPLARREHLIEYLEELSGARPGGLQLMTAEDVRTLYAKGFSIGAHTVNHPILTLCSEIEARNEIAEGRECLSALISGRVDGFAYPNGRPAQDFNERHVRLAREAGYTYAVTTQWGAATPETSLLQIPRFTPWGPSSFHMSYQLARNYLLPGKTLGLTESVLV